MIDDVGAEEPRKLLELGEAEGLQATAGGDCVGNHPADQVMCVAKRQASDRQIIRELGRQRIALEGRGPQRVAVELQTLDQPRRDLKTRKRGIDAVEQRLLV